MIVSNVKRLPFLLALMGLLILVAGCQSVSTDGPTEGQAAGDAVGTGSGIDLDAQESKLREAGSVTMRSSTTMTRRSMGSTASRNQTRYAELDFESGRAFTRLDPLGGSIREAYRTGSDGGVTYEVRNPETYPHYVDPERSREIDRSQLVGILSVDEAALERRGADTVDGVSGTVYVADSFEAVEPGAYDSMTPSDVTDFRVTYVVDEGVVRYQRIDLTATRDGVEVSESTRTRFNDVGSTTVSQPDWLETAKSEASKADFDDVIVRTYNASGDGELVELDVAAKRGELAATSRVGPRISDDPLFEVEDIDRYRVGSVAEYSYQVDSVENVTISVHYDDGAVAAANESDLRLVTMNRTYLSEPVEATVDSEANVVSVTFTDPEKLDQYQGKTFLVFKWPQFRQTMNERPSDE